MSLKTYIECECGKRAQIHQFNKDKKNIIYKCSKGHKTIKKFEDIESKSNKYEDFILNSDGSVHGNALFMVIAI